MLYIVGPHPPVPPGQSVPNCQITPAALGLSWDMYCWRHTLGWVVLGGSPVTAKTPIRLQLNSAFVRPHDIFKSGSRCSLFNVILSKSQAIYILADNTHSLWRSIPVMFDSKWQSIYWYWIPRSSAADGVGLLSSHCPTTYMPWFLWFRKLSSMAYPGQVVRRSIQFPEIAWELVYAYPTLQETFLPQISDGDWCFPVEV